MGLQKYLGARVQQEVVVSGLERVKLMETRTTQTWVSGN